MRWLPRFSLTDALSCDHKGELEGPQFCVEWCGWVIELTILRRTRLVSSACICRPYPEFFAKDCPQHGVDYDETVI